MEKDKIKYSKAKVGDKYGYITIIKDTGKRSRNGAIIWLCKCVCGKEIERNWNGIHNSLKQNCIISCGCRKPNTHIGRRELNNPKRIEKAREGMGIVDGTMLCMINRKNMNKNNTSGVRGVYYSNRKRKWVATIQFRRAMHKKYFDKKEDAIEYRKKLEEEYFRPILEKYGRNGV